MTVAMSKRMYERLLKGKVFASGRKIRGCGDKHGLILYLNRTGGYLEPVTDVQIE